MKKIWQTFCGYIWWTYPRGSLHYDVMVTLILAFIFLAPFWINFKDKPTERAPHPTAGVILVSPDKDGFIYQVDAAAVPGQDVNAELLRVIEPIAGEVEISRFEKVFDHGKLVAYKVWVLRH